MNEKIEQGIEILLGIQGYAYCDDCRKWYKPEEQTHSYCYDK
jgi:hypothetical protein